MALSESAVKVSVHISDLLPCEVLLLFGDVRMLIKNRGLIQYWYIIFSSNLPLHAFVECYNNFRSIFEQQLIILIYKMIIL